MSLEACRQSLEEDSEDIIGVQCQLKDTRSSTEVRRWMKGVAVILSGRFPPAWLFPSLRRGQNRGIQEQKEHFSHSPSSTTLPCNARLDYLGGVTLSREAKSSVEKAHAAVVG